jgi:hypothetical protein
MQIELYRFYYRLNYNDHFYCIEKIIPFLFIVIRLSTFVLTILLAIIIPYMLLVALTVYLADLMIVMY